jgi:type I restriction enzyme S subunit
MDEWKEVKLKEIADIRDGTHDSPKPASSGKPLVTSKHIKGGKLDLSSAYLISHQDFENVNKRSKVDKWDILFSMIGTVGEMVVINEEPDFAIKNVGLFKTGDEKLAKWIYYYLLSPNAQNELSSSLKGSTQQYISLTDLRNFPINLPPQKTRDKITENLSSLDDKNELNNAINKNLEDLAQALFKRWFVDFEFPNEEGLPYQSSGGEMVESELGMIPKGWRVENIEEITKVITKGTTPTTIGGRFTEYGINFIKVESISETGNIIRSKLGFIDEETNNLLKRSIIQEGDVLFSIAGTIGRVAIANKSILPANTNQAIAIIRPDKLKVDSYFLKLLMLSSLIQKDTKANIVQAVQANLSLGMIKQTKFILPQKELLSKFSEVNLSLFSKIEELSNEIEILTKLRDTLLPKLISGELEVNQALSETEKAL